MDKWGIPMFNFKAFLPNEIRDKWIKYKRHFNYVAAANEETDKQKLKNIFLARAGPEVQEVFHSLAADEDKQYDEMIIELDKYFSPKHHETYERHVFWTLKPESGEPLEKFLLRAGDQAGKCNFGSSKEESRSISMIDKTVLLAPTELKEKLLQEQDLTVDKMTKLVTAYQSVKYQASQMSDCKEGNKPLTDVAKIQNYKRCNQCGQSNHDSGDLRCPARNKRCLKCGKIGHFAIRCMSRALQTGNERRDFKNSTPPLKRQKVRAVEDSSGSRVEDVNSNFVFNVNEGDEYLCVKLGGVLMRMLIDSGSNKNLIDDRSWESLKRMGIQVYNQRQNCDQEFRVYGNQPLKVMQVFEATITVNDCGRVMSTEATFFVIQNGSQPILGKESAKELGVLILGLPSTWPSNMNMVNTKEKRPFPKMKGIQLHIPINENITPVVQHARRPPVSLSPKLKIN